MTTFQLNGQAVTAAAEDDTPLLWVLRDELKLTGTKFGCGAAQCGACTVYLDGQPTRSCVTSIADAAGKSVVTIEGLNGKVADAVRSAWQKLDVVQCGYCQSGQMMAAAALLSANPVPSDRDIADALDGNICRCNTYQRIRSAVHAAAVALKD